MSSRHGAFGTGSAILTGQAGDDSYVFGVERGGHRLPRRDRWRRRHAGLLRQTSGITLDLSKVCRAGEIDSGLTVTLSAVNDFENAVGTPGTDTITGNELDNRLTGGAGDDTLTGDLGDDTYVLA